MEFLRLEKEIRARWERIAAGDDKVPGLRRSTPLRPGLAERPERRAERQPADRPRSVGSLTPKARETPRTPQPTVPAEEPESLHRQTSRPRGSRGGGRRRRTADDATRRDEITERAPVTAPRDEAARTPKATAAPKPAPARAEAPAPKPALKAAPAPAADPQPPAAAPQPPAAAPQPPAAAPQPPAAAPQPVPTAFAELGLPDLLLQGVRDAGFVTPTAIQVKAIPPAMAGRDLVGQAKTGTGKTAAFSLPVLHRTVPGEGTAALILAPTRELAIQVRREIEELARHSKLRIALIYGGVGFDGQLAALRAGAEIVVGTPGRVLDHYRRGTFRLDKIRTVVLDECDRMFDLGFRPDIERVLNATSPARQQLLLFSATVGKDVLQIAKRFMNDPEIVYTAPETLTVDNVEQFYCTVSARKKTSLVAALVRRELEAHRLVQAIVFSRTKRGCDRLAKSLREMGLQAHPIHGDLSQPRREAVLRDVRNKKVRILVATDVAARGLDIDGISHVFNYDIPEYPEDYVHRIGRTARMGAKGTAFTLVAPGQGGFLTEIEKLTNVLVEPFEMTDFDLGVEDLAPARPKGTGRILYSSHPNG